MTATLREVVDAIRGCALEKTDSLEAATESLRSGRVGMVVAHVAHPAAGAEVARWVEEARCIDVSVPIVVLMERDDPELHLQFISVDHLQVEFLVHHPLG